MPNLAVLDDELTLNTKSILRTSSGSTQTKPAGRTKVDTSNNEPQQCPFDADWEVINQWIEEGIGPPEEKLAINGKTELRNEQRASFYLLLF